MCPRVCDRSSTEGSASCSKRRRGWAEGMTPAGRKTSSIKTAAPPPQSTIHKTQSRRKSITRTLAHIARARARTRVAGPAKRRNRSFPRDPRLRPIPARHRRSAQAPERARRPTAPPRLGARAAHRSSPRCSSPFHCTTPTCRRAPTPLSKNADSPLCLLAAAAVHAAVALAAPLLLPPPPRDRTPSGRGRARARHRVAAAARHTSLSRSDQQLGATTP